MHLSEIDKYAHRESMFHTWDPRVKAVSLLFMVCSVALLTDIMAASLALFITGIFILLSRIPFAFVLRQLKWVAVFLAFLMVVLPLTAGSNSGVAIGPVTISWKGIELALLIALRALSMCALVFLMFATTEFHQNLKALYDLKVPEPVVQIIMFTYRYIFILMDELRTMLTAAHARCFTRRTSLYTLRTIANITGMLFVRGFERAQDVYNAMVSRGYRGKLTVMNDGRLCSKDFLKAGAVITVAVVIHYIGYIGIVQ